MPLSAIPAERALIVWHPSDSLPDGYIKANGAELSRTVYAWLFSKIGTTWGAGNGSTTFNAPDLRAEFLRGLDDGRGVDPARVIGSAQASTAIRNQVGTTHAIIATNYDSVALAADIAAPGADGSVNRTPSVYTIRPRNVAGLYCVAYMP